MAKLNIKNGPTIQVMKKETKSNFRFPKTFGIFSKRTFAKGGYIININPIAKGILVVPVENELIKPDDSGMKYPIATPVAIARKIQRVRYWSKKLNFFLLLVIILRFKKSFSF
jgi:hypothetical protein